MHITNLYRPFSMTPITQPVSAVTSKPGIAWQAVYQQQRSCLSWNGSKAEMLRNLPANERFDGVAGHVVRVLLGRALHEVARRREDGAADAAVEGERRGPHGVDDDPRGVGGIPDLELVLQVQRH